MDVLTLIDRLEVFYYLYGYSLVFLSSLVEISPFGWAVPGGTLLSLAGFFAYGGRLSLAVIILSGWFGAWITFIAAYFLGKYTGWRLVKKLKQEKNAKRAKSLLSRHGGTILTTSMLANLTRFWVAYVSGAQHYPFSKFLFYSGVASLAWSSLMIVVGYLAGSGRTEIENALGSLGLLSWAVVIFAVVILYLKIRKGLLEAS